MPRINPEDAQRRHRTDILGAVSREIAHPVATFYRGLLDEGLAPDVAVQLTAEYTRLLLDAIVKPG